MTISTAKSAFWKGVRDSAPFVLVSGPFGLLFGVLAAEAGLNVLEAMSFSLAVFAGSAQFTALQLMQEHTPTLIVLISALAVNLRVAMYSASLTPYLGDAPLWQRACAAYLTVDQAYALSMIEFERRAEWGTRERMAYFFGTNGLVAPAWMAATITGALVGASIPDSLGLDFVLPIAFLAMIGPMLRTPAHVVACFTACAVSLPATLMPYNLGLIIAGIAGMMAGAQAEVWFERKSAAAEAKTMTGSEMAFDRTTLWLVIIGLAVGSYALRFAFIGLVGNRAMPAWLMRHLRYTAVAIIPALVAPLVVWPAPTDGAPSLIHFAAAALTFAVAVFSKNVLLAMATGACSLWTLMYLFG